MHPNNKILLEWNGIEAALCGKGADGLTLIITARMRESMFRRIEVAWQGGANLEELRKMFPLRRTEMKW